MTSDSAPADSSDARPAHTSAHAPGGRGRFFGLALGAMGVVFGDIGTSPLYAFGQGLKAASADGLSPPAIIGVISLMLWSLMVVVTVKYATVIMRADNKGEGGILALMALAQHALGGRTRWIFFLGVFGAALFYGDALLTPAVTVLSAVEGLRSVPHIGPHVTHAVVLIVSLVILLSLFIGQSRGTAKMAGLFGPICLVWFLSIAALGVIHLLDQPQILWALSPWPGVKFLLTHGVTGFFVLGSAFLTVTGAEALYADMGHFGKWPIRAAWLFLVLPCLWLNYLGQGAFALHELAAHGGNLGGHNWFYEMAPALVRVPLLLLAIGVVLLVAIFKSSAAMTQAYGIAVSATMSVDTSLAFIVMWKLWKWPPWVAALVAAPLICLDLTFFSANLLKIFEGGFVPILLGAGMFAMMYTWVRGTNLLTLKTSRESPPLKDFVRLISERPPTRVKGTAVFLTSDVERTPAALLHNLKHNQVLHEHNIIMTVRTADTPRAPPSDRLKVEVVNDSFKTAVATFGFMESPNVPEALRQGRTTGLSYSHMTTSFFLGRRTVVAAARHSLMPNWQDKLFILMMKNAAAPTDFFHIPAGRVVEMGSQITV